jgi:hypothetical protein
LQVTIGPRLLTVNHARLLTFEALGLLALDVPNLFSVSAACKVARLLVLHLAFGTVLTLDLARLLVPDLLMPDLLMLGLLMLGTTHLRAFGALHLWGTHFHAMSAAVALTATAARLLHRLGTATATAAAVTLAAAMALTAATVLLGRRRRTATTIALIFTAATTVAAAWPRACRGRDRERGNAGCEKYPGQHR